MDIYFLRHAIAGERDQDKYPDDTLRPLTKKGAKKLQRIAEGMLALDLSFDVIYTSPLVRAKQTAEIITRVFNADRKLRETDRLAPGGDPRELIDMINRARDEHASVLLVGHEPYLSDLISVLVVGDSSLPLTMKKGGVCKLSVGALKYGKCASLEWLLPPSICISIK